MRPDQCGQSADNLTPGDRAAVAEAAAYFRTRTGPPQFLHPDVLTLVQDFIDTDPCQLDHNGNCQAHGWFDWGEGPGCPHGRAKQMLADMGIPLPD